MADVAGVDLSFTMLTEPGVPATVVWAVINIAGVDMALTTGSTSGGGGGGGPTIPTTGQLWPRGV